MRVLVWVGVVGVVWLALSVLAVAGWAAFVRRTEREARLAAQLAQPTPSNVKYLPGSGHRP